MRSVIEDVFDGITGGVSLQAWIMGSRREGATDEEIAARLSQIVGIVVSRRQLQSLMEN